jgi:alkylhydroperoxidase/carboxymuconolactone decarboxylase family protein YurZ
VAGLEETLARITLRDDRFIAALPGSSHVWIDLDTRTDALVGLAAVIGLDGAMASFVASVQAAKSAGASDDEIVATLVDVLPTVGVVRGSSAASKIALALGLELDSALENRG